MTRVTGVFDESYGGASRQLIEQEESREGEKDKLMLRFIVRVWNPLISETGRGTKSGVIIFRMRGLPLRVSLCMCVGGAHYADMMTAATFSFVGNSGSRE